jgi:hypothetical protein
MLEVQSLQPTGIAHHICEGLSNKIYSQPRHPDTQLNHHQRLLFMYLWPILSGLGMNYQIINQGGV